MTVKANGGGASDNGPLTQISQALFTMKGGER